MVKYVLLTSLMVAVGAVAACTSDGGSSEEAQAGKSGSGSGAAAGTPDTGGTQGVGEAGMNGVDDAGAPSSSGGTTGTGGANQGGGGGKASGGTSGMGGGGPNPEGCDVPEAVVSCYTALGAGLGICSEAYEEGQAADFVRAACGGELAEGESCPESAEDAELANYCVGMNGVTNYCYAAEGMPQCSGPPAACTNQGGIYCTP